MLIFVDKNKLYSQIINEINQKITKINNSNEKEKEKTNKFYIDYHEVPNLSNNKMIKILIDHDYKYNDIKDLHSHILKQMINKIDNEKMDRKFNKAKF